MQWNGISEAQYPISMAVGKPEGRDAWRSLTPFGFGYA